VPVTGFWDAPEFADGAQGAQFVNERLPSQIGAGADDD
jgi:hypothetical protein